MYIHTHTSQGCPVGRAAGRLEGLGYNDSSNNH